MCEKKILNKICTIVWWVTMLFKKRNLYFIESSCSYMKQLSDSSEERELYTYNCRKESEKDNKQYIFSSLPVGIYNHHSV